MASQDGYLVRVDPSTTPLSYVLQSISLPCYLLDSLAISREGDVLLSGFACDQVVRFDAATGRSTALATLPNPRGLTFDRTGAWVAHTDGRLSHVSLSPFVVDATVDLRALGATPIDSAGVAIDALGAVWAVSRLGGASSRGVATRVAPSTNVVNAQVTVGAGPFHKAISPAGRASGAALSGAPVRWPRPSRLEEPVTWKPRPAAEAAEALGLTTVGKLLDHLPRDSGEARTIGELRPTRPRR